MVTRYQFTVSCGLAGFNGTFVTDSYGGDRVDLEYMLWGGEGEGERGRERGGGREGEGERGEGEWRGREKGEKVIAMEQKTT